MRDHKISLIILGLTLSLTPLPGRANNASISGGENLLRAPDARSFSLANAISADANQIAVYSLNPAALPTLKSGQASLMHEKGLTDDSFTQIMAGSRFSFGSIGGSFSYYDGGSFRYYDGTTSQDVKAQTDYIASLGYGRAFGKLETGISAKYISSELIERNKATSAALDVGLGAAISNNFRMAWAFQNLGSQLSYDKHGDRLPVLTRLGAAWTLPFLAGSALFLDLPYYLNEKELEGAIAGEAWLGPLALRVGYKTGVDLGGFTAGAGFQFKRLDLNYGFGLIEDLDSQHMVSLSFRFGRESSPQELSKKDIARPVQEAKNPAGTWSPLSDPQSLDSKIGRAAK